MSEDTNVRVGADGDVEQPGQATQDVVVASIPGDDESKFVTLTLAHPLTKSDRVYLGLPEDAKTEVGQQVKVNKNGARALINAGLVTIDPEDSQAVRSALRGESAGAGTTAAPSAEAIAPAAANPPQAQSTPVAENDPIPGAQGPEEPAAGVEEAAPAEQTAAKSGRGKAQG